MARPVYPLQALRELRDERARAQQLLLAEHVTRTQQALAALTKREQVCREHARRTAAELEAERQRLLQTPSLGADLLRLAEFEAAARTQAALLERAAAEAREKLSSERAEEQGAREALAQREAEAKAVAEHEAGFHARAELTASRAEEEAMLEQWNARRP